MESNRKVRSIADSLNISRWQAEVTEVAEITKVAEEQQRREEKWRKLGGGPEPKNTNLLNLLRIFVS